MSSLTPQFFDTLIIVVILIGLAWAGVRFYREMQRPLPPERRLPPMRPQARPEVRAEIRTQGDTKPTPPRRDNPTP